MISTLDIRIEGEPVDLNVGAAWELQLLNSMLNIDAPKGSRAIGITVPFTPKNTAFLGQIHHPQVGNTKRNFYTDIYLATTLIDMGYMYLKDAVNAYQFDFTSNIAEFFGAYQTRLLSELDLGSIPVPVYNDTLATLWQSTNGCCFPTIKNPVFYEKNVPGTYDGFINKYTASSYVSTSPKVPCFFMKHILQKVGDLAGVSFAGEFWSDARTAALLLYNTREVGTAPAIERRLFMPEMTIGQLILGLRKTFNLRLSFDVYRRVLRMDYSKNVYNGACTFDLSSKARRPNGGSPFSSAGLELSWTVDSGDQLNKDTFFLPYATAVPVGGGQLQKVQSPFRSLMMDAGLPYTKQFGITADQGEKKFVPGLLYWKGVVGGVPLASNTNGTTVLDWNHVNGLYANFWQEEEAFRQNAYKIQQRMALNTYEVARVSSILRGESDELPIFHHNGTNYLIDELIVPSNKPNLPQMTAWRL
ncbi:hypothetical protein [Runella salmonicolor]|uniref:Major capsid protein n=1 Tax=Runella salmonicolor TaxID=2950278 RepID=A0ABT1FRP1_9BACT|nr:hypothetical protein [Runella salmonicolor]MCP1384429.1 hypothetical protein [Runella salmonicolor]